MLYLASCGSNIKLFEVPSYDLKYEYDPYCGSTVSKSMTVSEHGELFATIPQKGSIEVVAFKNDGWNKFRTIQNVNNPTVATFQHSVKRHLAIGTKTGELILYDLKKNCVRKTLTSANDAISLLDFCVKDTHLAAGCLNGDILLYSMGSNITTEKLMVRSTSNSVSAIRFHSLQRSLFAAANDEGDVVVWDINTKRKKFGLKNAHSAPCVDVAFSPLNVSFMTSVGYDCIFNCYDLQNNVKVVSKLMDHPLQSHDIMSNGTEIAMGTKDGLIYVLDLRNCNNILATMKADTGDINNLVYKTIGDNASCQSGSLTSLNNLNEVKDQNMEEDNEKNIESCFSHALNSLIINLDTENHSSPKNANVSVDSFLHTMGMEMPSNLSFTSIGDDCIKEIISEGTNEWVETKANLMDGTVTIDNTILSPFKIADSETTELTSSPLNTDIQSVDISIIQESCTAKEPQRSYGNNTIEHLIELIKKQNEDVSEKMRFEFMNMKLCLVKQFIYHEQRMNLIFQKLMEEIKLLKSENDDLRTKLRH